MNFFVLLTMREWEKRLVILVRQGSCLLDSVPMRKTWNWQFFPQESLIQVPVLMNVISLHGVLFPLGNPYSTQAPSGHMKCPTPPPSKSQSLSRKHSIELGQVGLLSPAALSPMQSESTFHLLCCLSLLQRLIPG